MRRLTLIIIALVVFAFSASAQKGSVKYQGEVFVSGNVAKSDVSLTLCDETIEGTPMMYGLSVSTIQGAKFGEYFSVGIGTGIDFLVGIQGDISMLALLIPIYADFKFWIPTSGRLQPYIMAEAGGSFAIHPQTIRPLYGGGVGLKITERFAMSLNYINDGYKVYDKEVGDALKSMYKEHKVQLRFTWIF